MLYSLQYDVLIEIHVCLCYFTYPVYMCGSKKDGVLGLNSILVKRLYSFYGQLTIAYTKIACSPLVR